MLVPDDYAVISTFNDDQFRIFSKHAPDAGKLFNYAKIDFAKIRAFDGDCGEIKQCVEIIKRYPTFTFRAIITSGDTDHYKVTKIYCMDEFPYDVKKLHDFAAIIKCNCLHANVHKYSEVFCDKRYRFGPHHQFQSFIADAISNLIPYDVEIIEAFVKVGQLFSQ